MPSKNTTPINLRNYKKEWKIFDKRIKELSERNSFHNYVNNRMLSLVKDYNNCPECILESLSENIVNKKRHYVPNEVYKIFKEISDKSNMPITVIIDRLIIVPLLLEK
jgi:hypothetical protein